MSRSSALRRPPAPLLPSAPAGELGTAVDRERRRGRGTVSNAVGRYEPLARVAFDDGWQGLDELPPFKTTVTVDATRKIIARNDSPDISFDRSINPYRGCEHGCVYCFARPTHAYLGLSPGLDFESKLFMKPNAPELLERELAAPSYVPKIIAIGTNTDPYQPIERRYQIMRRILEVLERAGHPVGIVTKSALVLRDLDILTRMAKRDLVKVAISVTTLDPKLARIMEPRAAAPTRRLAAIAGLRAQNIPVGVMAAPMIPGLNDAELESILEAAAKAGAQSAGYTLLRLPHELAALFTDWLHTHLPERAAHVLSLIRQSRAGALNDSRFHERFKGSGPFAELLHQRFARAVKQLGLERMETLDTSCFAVPRGPGAAQMSLF